MFRVRQMSCPARAVRIAVVLLSTGLMLFQSRPARAALPKIAVATEGRTFVDETGKPFVPFGVNYYRPGTGWAPQVWKQFDPELTRMDFARMKEVGVNCVRIFLTFHSFHTEPGQLRADGAAKFDQ